VEKMEKKKEKRPFIKTRTRIDNSVEIELQKSPAKTFLGKLLIVLIVIGTVLVPLVVLFYVIANK
jgi:Zn-dependent membrane protease YugP